MVFPLSPMTPHRSNKTSSAFSLVEVVLAIGVFSLAIVAVFGLLIPITRDSSSVIDTSTAIRLAEGVNRELERVGGETVKSLGNGSLFLVATPDGSRILRTYQTANGSNSGAAQAAENDPSSGTPPGIVKRDRFYIIEVKLLNNSANKVYYNSADNPGSIPVEVRVGWPFYTPSTPPPSTPPSTWDDSSVNGVIVPAASRSYYLFASAIRR